MVKRLLKRHWAALFLLLGLGWFVFLNLAADTNPDIIFLRSYPQNVQKIRGILVGDLFEPYRVETRFGYVLERKVGETWIPLEGKWPHIFYEMSGYRPVYCGFVVTFDLSPFGTCFEPGEYRLRQLVIAERDTPIDLATYPETTMEFEIQ